MNDHLEPTMQRIMNEFADRAAADRHPSAPIRCVKCGEISTFQWHQIPYVFKRENYLCITCGLEHSTGEEKK